MESSLLNKATATADVDLSIIKVSAYIVAVSLSALMAGYFIAEVSPIWGTVSLMLFWVLFTLQIFFIKDWIRILIAVFAESLMLTLPAAIIFRDNFSGFVLLAFGVIFAGLLITEKAGRSDFANSLKIPLWRASRHIAAKVITATLAFVAVVYMFVAGGSIMGKEGAELVSDKIILPAVRTVIPDFTPEMTFSQVVGKILERDPRFKALSQSQRSEATASTVSSFEKTVGEINESLPIGAAIYTYFADRFTNSPLGAKLMAVLILVAILWGFIKAISLILFIPVAALTALFYELFIVLNFSSIQYESRSREIILLK